MDLNDKLANVRNAHRLLAAYNRRLITIVEMLQAHLGQRPELPLSWVERSTTHTRSVGRQTTGLAGRWGWDFLPLSYASMYWSTDGGYKPRHSPSACIQLTHVIDTGWQHKGSEPDPNTFKNASDCDSELILSVFALCRGTCDMNWTHLDKHGESLWSDEEAYSGKLFDFPADTITGANDDTVVRYIAALVPMVRLEREEDVVREVLRTSDTLLQRALEG